MSPSLSHTESINLLSNSMLNKSSSNRCVCWRARSATKNNKVFIFEWTEANGNYKCGENRKSSSENRTAMNTKVPKKRKRKKKPSFIRRNNGEVNCDKSEFLLLLSLIWAVVRRASTLENVCSYTKEYFYIRVACSLISEINLFFSTAALTGF